MRMCMCVYIYIYIYIYIACAYVCKYMYVCIYIYKEVEGHSHALMPLPESSGHKVFPSTIHPHSFIKAYLIFHGLWYLMWYLGQP